MINIAPTQRPALAASTRSGWWLFFFRGVLALAIGAFAIFDPGATLAALILLIGAFFIVDGIFTVAKAFGAFRSTGARWMLLLSGIVGIVAGVLVFAWPGLTAFTLDILIGIWAIVTGVAELIAAFSLHRAIGTQWLYGIFGVISIAFGAYVLIVPGLGLVYLTFMIAIYGFVAGVSLIGAALRLRSAAH
jgi:uncharacterized membrane protein HdeD (DUF308 family)